ncbi:amidohydrolase [Nocardioides sp. NPDC004968]|uniref:amidohydrolase n=1 Tax=Nocardioides sp. NPDC004968 TaxID=3155894 RepID=UPI0033A89721
MTGSRTLRNATLADGSRVDVSVADGRISGISPASSAAAGADLDLGGALLLPALVNGHAHLDKTLVGSGWQPHRPGTTVRERVAAEHTLRGEVGVPVVERARALAEQMISFGTGTVRTHVDIDPEVGLAGLEAVLEVREALRDRLRIEIVAFPQSGITTSPGTEKLLDEALAAGADLVGGLDPDGFDGDAEAHLDVVFGLAARHGAGVDIHLHDLGASAVRQYELIAARTRAEGLGGKVNVSHAYGLGSIPLEEARRVGGLFAEAGVSVLTNGPAGPMPPVLALREVGATVWSGSDNIRDAWWPYGDGDMLAIARQVAYQSGFRTDETLTVALDLVTDAAARALGLEAYGIVVGAPADLLVLDVPTPAAAISANPTSRTVLHAGEVVATRVETVEVSPASP